MKNPIKYFKKFNLFLFFLLAYSLLFAEYIAALLFEAEFENHKFLSTTIWATLVTIFTSKKFDFEKIKTKLIFSKINVFIFLTGLTSLSLSFFDFISENLYIILLVLALICNTLFTLRILLKSRKCKNE